MPRNPHKRRCQSPGCKAYAMRQLPDGTAANFCRSHLDHLLGPRHVGAPRGNLNAVKSGRYAHPVPTDKLDTLALELAKDPDLMPLFLSDQYSVLQERTGDVFTSLLLLYRMLQQLLPLLADHLFHIEVSRFIQQMPPEVRPRIEAIVWQHTLKLNPMKRLTDFREVRADIYKQYDYLDPDL